MENHEKNIALMETVCRAGEDEYFAARPKRDDTAIGHMIYQAGFRRAWRIAHAAAEECDKLRNALIPLANAHSPAERECLTDEDVKAAASASLTRKPGLSTRGKHRPKSIGQK